MLFELFLLRVPKRDSNPQPNLRSAIWVLIAQWLERLTGDLTIVGSSPTWELRISDIFLSKNSSKNVIITIFMSELAYIF